MTAEIPLLAAAAARKGDPAVNLAAWGVVFPLALILASPVMMLLSASTTLSKDSASYRTLRKYMLVLAAVLTGVHALLAFTPLFYLLVEEFIGVPPQVVEPARLGFQIMLPWAAALAYRRFNYGVLIRFEHTRAVTVGAIVRLLCDGIAMIVLFYVFDIPGIAVAAGVIVAGVIGEAIYAKIRVRPVLRDEMSVAPPVAETLTLRLFVSFYVPLVMTSLLSILVQPIGSMALSRMPDPLSALAVWPVVYGVLIVLALLWTVPTIGLLASSFRHPDDVADSGWWTMFNDLSRLSLNNYRVVLGIDTQRAQQEGFLARGQENINLSRAILNSLTVAIPATLIPILIAAFAAYGFAWLRFPGRRLFFISVVAMLVVPLQVALIPILRDYIALDLNGTFLGVWLAHTGFGLALATYLLYNYISALPRDILESAFLDGASSFTIFTRLILPLSMPAVASFAIFQFASPYCF